MKKPLIFILLIFTIILSGIFVYYYQQATSIISPLSKKKEVKKEKPLLKYSFENLRKKEFKPLPVTLSEVLKEDEDFVTHLFFFETDPSFTQGRPKRVSGLINIPTKPGVYPVIVMLRGFVDKSIYTTGEGTRRSAEELAKNGFVTLAPDFLGYGQSDQPTGTSLEDRFQTYTTSLSLLASIPNINAGLEASYSARVKADTEKIGVWGHSNGGHIALSVMAITGKEYPTVLWNPVSKPFPYSILYYTDEFDDHGKSLRKVVSDFEKDYDVNYFSPYNYYQWIQAPLQLHQAENDEAVPVRWSNQLYEHLNTLEKDIEYFSYPSENHNFTNGSWPLAIKRSVDFYNKWFE